MGFKSLSDIMTEKRLVALKQVYSNYEVMLNDPRTLAQLNDPNNKRPMLSFAVQTHLDESQINQLKKELVGAGWFEPQVYRKTSGSGMELFQIEALKNDPNKPAEEPPVEPVPEPEVPEPVEPPVDSEDGVEEPPVEAQPHEPDEEEPPLPEDPEGGEEEPVAEEPEAPVEEPLPETPEAPVEEQAPSDEEPVQTTP